MTNNEQRRSNPQNRANSSRPANRSTASRSTASRRTSGRSGASSGRNPNRSVAGGNPSRSTARRRKRPRRKMERLLRSGPVRIVFVLIAAVILILLAVNIYKGFLCKGSYTIEAGTSFDISDFLKKENPDAYFTKKSDTVDTSVPGNYTLRIKNGIFTHKCKLRVVDTTAPQGTANNLQVALGKEYSAEDFVTDIVDVTPVTVTFAKTPDFSQEGSQNVELILQDTSKNKTTLTAPSELETGFFRSAENALGVYEEDGDRGPYCGRPYHHDRRYRRLYRRICADRSILLCHSALC